mgnify:CR=1 FL=1
MKLRTKVRKIISKFLSDKMYIKLQYRFITGRTLNLKNPKRFNEKLQWLKLYDHKPEYTTYVDKYRVKEYVKNKIGEKYIIPTIGVWPSASEIDITELPDQFVLKCNHDSKSVFICKDRRKFKFNEVLLKLNGALKKNQFYYGREWPYKNVHPLIIAEKYMEDESGGLQDYKVMCFNGKAKLIQVHQGRFTDHYTHDIYDRDWIHQKFNQKGEVYADKILDKPVFLEEMLLLSEILSKNIPQIRVDWYYVNNQLYFGEMTFFDAAGYLDFVPDEYNEIIGNWISLPEKNV